ncbi:MAG: DUF4124 domain-containing protein [Pseudomonadota bacterium]
MALFVSASAHAAEIYRWVDENGVVNFTQQKPKDVQAEVIGKPTNRRVSVAETAPAPAVPLAAQDEQKLTDEQQRILDDLKTAEMNRQAALAEAKATNCERARKVLTNLTKIGRVRVVAEDGTQTVLPEEDRQARIQAAQEAIAVNCAG